MGFNLKDMVRRNVWSMKAYSSARSEFSGQARVWLDANESPYASEFNRYPDPNQKDLKDRIAEIKGVVISNITIGNGSDEILDLLIRTFCEPGMDQLITLPPTYGMYETLSELNGIGLIEVPLNPRFELDAEKIKAKIDKTTKLIFICSPNNPTGNILPTESILKLLDENIIVVVDEAYVDFSDTKSMLSFLDQYPNLVICQTLSKAYGLAGLRLGLCFASEEISQLMKKVKAPYNVNTASQKLALEAISSMVVIEKRIETIKEERERVIYFCKQLSFIKEIFPSQSNFILIRVKEVELLYQYLVSKKIVVRNRSSQLNCENCLRIGIGTKLENDYLLEQLKSF